MEFLRMIWDMETMETRVPRLALLSTFLFFFAASRDPKFLIWMTQGIFKTILAWLGTLSGTIKFN